MTLFRSRSNNHRQRSQGVEHSQLPRIGVKVVSTKPAGQPDGIALDVAAQGRVVVAPVIVVEVALGIEGLAGEAVVVGRQPTLPYLF